MWPFRKRPTTDEDPPADAGLEQIRRDRAKVKQFTAEAQQVADRLERLLNRNDGRRMGKA